MDHDALTRLPVVARARTAQVSRCSHTQRLLWNSYLLLDADSALVDDEDDADDEFFEDDFEMTEEMDQALSSIELQQIAGM